jgi:GT2 family glycosyltransferase
MTSTLPTVSVVVPSYGRPARLRACLEALDRQDYPDELVDIRVVDDGTPTPLAGALGDVDIGPRVHFLRQENSGPAAARNRGARESTATVLAFTDDDCEPRPGWLRHLVRSVLREPDALVGGTTVNALSRNIWAEASQDLVTYLYTSFETAQALLPFFTSNNIAMMREGFERVGGFDETFVFSAGEDRDFSERWVATGGRMVHVADAMVDHYHQLTAARFLRQHYRYGRGAGHLAKRRLARGQERLTPEPLSFYSRMFAHPFEGRGLIRGAAVSGLVIAAQAIGVAGMVHEALAPSGSRDIGDARTGPDVG